MNDLSNEVKAKETHEKAIMYSHLTEKNLYMFTMQMREIRDERLYKELGYTDFENYCQDAWNLKRRVVDERIQIANTLSKEEFESHGAKLGHKKTLLIATMNEKQREEAINEGIPTEEGKKTLSDASRKQIEEFKKQRDEAKQQAKQAESQAETERKERERLERENEELANVEPERIEVVPDDYDFYKGNYESAVNLQKRYKDQMEEMRKELNETDNKGGDKEDRLRKREKTLKNKIKSIEKINDVQFHLDDVISQISTKTHSLDVNELLNDYQVLDDFESTINEVINVCKELKNKLPNKNIIEGEIVNE